MFVHVLVRLLARVLHIQGYVYFNFGRYMRRYKRVLIDVTQECVYGLYYPQICSIDPLRLAPGYDTCITRDKVPYTWEQSRRHFNQMHRCSQRQSRAVFCMHADTWRSIRASDAEINLLNLAPRGAWQNALFLDLKRNDTKWRDVGNTLKLWFHLYCCLVNIGIFALQVGSLVVRAYRFEIFCDIDVQGSDVRIANTTQIHC